MQLALSICHGCCAYNSYDFDSYHLLVIAYICTPGTKVARYEKRPEIKEWFVKTTLEQLENLNLNSTNSVRNDCLISSINWNVNLTPFYQGPSPPPPHKNSNSVRPPPCLRLWATPLKILENLIPSLKSSKSTLIQKSKHSFFKETKDFISKFSFVSIRQHIATRKHLFLYPQGDRSGLRKPKKVKHQQ